MGGNKRIDQNQKNINMSSRYKPEFSKPGTGFNVKRKRTNTIEKDEETQNNSGK